VKGYIDSSFAEGGPRLYFGHAKGYRGEFVQPDEEREAREIRQAIKNPYQFE